MADKPKSIAEQLADMDAILEGADRGMEASYKKVDQLAEEGRRGAVTSPKKAPTPAYTPPVSKENMSVQELLALQRAETERALRREEETRRRAPAAPKAVRTAVKAPQGIPGLDKTLAAADAVLKRYDELGESQQRLLDEMAAYPLEKEVDAVYADMGKQLYTLEEEETTAATEAAAFLEADERNDEAEDELERSGKPPPLRVVK